MSYYKFKSHDILINNLKTFPSYNFYVYDGKIYLDNKPKIAGSFTSDIGLVPTGHLSLYEINVDRSSGQTGLIYPFLTKDNAREGFGSVTNTSFAALPFGDVITGSYLLSSSLARDYYNANDARSKVDALRNTIDYYKRYSQRFSYSSSYYDFSTNAVNLISIPSIFYGEQIKKGSIVLKYYITGTLIGQAEDIRRNGELIQTFPVGSPGSGSVVGLALYNEGFFILTGSTDLDPTGGNSYGVSVIGDKPSWLFFGTYISGNTNYNGVMTNQESYSIYFEGVNTVPTMTMFMNAPKNELNNSSNPTFKTFTTSSLFITSSNSFIETEREIKNTVYSQYADPTGSFEKHTYITRINVYDENKNLIGIAKVSKPVKKTEGRDLTFKVKLDL